MEELMFPDVLEKQELETMREAEASAIETARAVAREIKDAPTLNRAAELMLEAKRRVRAIQERFAKPKSDAKKAHKSICDFESELIEPYERIEREILKPAIAQFSHEQEIIRRQEEERLREEAKKREEDARLAEAQRLADSGDSVLSDAVLNTPVEVAPVVLPRTETPAGISYREIWRFEIVDAASVPREYLVVDEKKVGGVVRALKAETHIPGVRVFSEKTVAGRL